MRALSFILTLFSTAALWAQPNCEAYKLYGDTLKYEACHKTKEVRGLYQFSKKYQTVMDEALAIDSTFDYPYWAKSIAYLKSGDFITWKGLIDKAVQYNPTGHLGYRGWCRYQFFRDYEGAISDLELLDSLVDYDPGYCQNGDYHLNIAKGLCYKAMGKKQKAIAIIEKQIEANVKDEFVGPYDFLHLGVLYLETEQFEKAIKAFTEQSTVNELAENQYYLALALGQQGQKVLARKHLFLAKELYADDQKMFDPYNWPMDKIFASDIEQQLSSLTEP